MQLELLAPAGTKDIGIAAIDCGADAVYIAGPLFGARQAAGNPVAEVGFLARYAHRFGARVYAVVNTILFDDELEAARAQMTALAEAGVDAFIIQDLGILKMDLPPVPLFASTQTAIRTPEDAMRLEALGFKRLILERQLSLDQIRAIRAAVQCDLEFFVHGALCVSYSGHCYLSQALAGRSANRGACIQACRSRYNLLDADGRVLLRDRSLLSLKDFRLDERLDDLVAAGISSFKIEGRLKNASYVKNVVRHYRAQLDAYLAAHPEHIRASAGTPVGGFTPDIEATFNRGYTQAFLDGRDGGGHGGPDTKWNSIDAAKSLGAYLGTIRAIEGNTIEIDTARTLAAGDGLAFIPREGELTGMRIEAVLGPAAGGQATGRPAGVRVRLKSTAGLYRGEKVYRNLDSALERELERNMPHRLIDAVIDYRTAGGQTTFTARVAEPGGQTAEVSFAETADVARNPETALETLRSQLSKTTEPYRFTLGKVEGDAVYFYPAAFLNGIRRQMSAALADKQLSNSELRNNAPLENSGATLSNQLSINEISAKGDTEGIAAGNTLGYVGGDGGDDIGSDGRDEGKGGMGRVGALDYRANCANHLAKEVLAELGAESVAPAYELEAPRGAEVMRTRYCIKHELGLCPKQRPGSTSLGSRPGSSSQELQLGKPSQELLLGKSSQELRTGGPLREPLWLENNGTRLKLEFDCKNCEMVVIL